jgi:hypothetical protein
MTSDQKMPRLWPPLKFDIKGGLCYTLSALLWNWRTLFSNIIFFPESGLVFSWGKIPNSAKIMLWRVNLSLQKYTFCKNWPIIVAQSWFGTRIYTRGLTLGQWSLSSKSKMFTYSFSLVFVQNFLSQSDQGPIQKRNLLFLFYFVNGRERTNGVKFIPPCLLRKLALLTCFARRIILIDQEPVFETNFSIDHDHLSKNCHIKYKNGTP